MAEQRFSPDFKEAIDGIYQNLFWASACTERALSHDEAYQEELKELKEKIEELEFKAQQLANRE